MAYIYDLAEWPRFTWDEAALSVSLARVRHRQGLLIGRMEGLGFEQRQESTLMTLTQDVLKSSEIEGEHLDARQVRSSVARRLGIHEAGMVPSERDVEGVVEMMLDATQRYDQPLTRERLFGWHGALFPSGRSGLVEIKVGGWRHGDMQVVSGPIGRERVHYQAPGADRLEREMSRFLEWFERQAKIDGLIKASLAHLWFVTIHPFDDGNGRIARAIADMSLARCEGSPLRFYSMSSQIRLEREDYYLMLETTQKAGLDVTRWHLWFLGCLERAFESAQMTLGGVLGKAKFWARFAHEPMNVRQREMVNRLLDGFEGKLTSSKWAKIAGCSQDTAARDIEDLVGRGVLVKGPGGGRSTHYLLVGGEGQTRV